MTLTFLGTAVANAYPEAFCRCNNCERARQLRGPSLGGAVCAQPRRAVVVSGARPQLSGDPSGR